MPHDLSPKTQQPETETRGQQQTPTATTKVGSRPPGRPLAAIILAAGKGTRMNPAGDGRAGSDLPKVAYEVAGRPMVWWVVQAARQAGANPIVLVVGHGADRVREIFSGDDDILFVVQEEQLGTGHATLCAEKVLDGFDGDVLVLAGDGPLVRSETLSILRRRHRESGAAATLATAVIGDPTGYGRIIRDKSGKFLTIVEHKNATDEQRQIHEIYPSYACFDAETLFTHLRALPADSVSGEYYLTEIPSILHREGADVETVDAVPPEEVLSINTPEQLAEVEKVLRRRLHGGSLMSASDRDYLKIFGGRAGEPLTRAMCEHLSIPLGQGTLHEFPDGEIITKVNEDVRGRDCFVVQSTCHPVNANLMELLIWIDCLRRASAKRITAVIPYLGYARQDRKDEGRVPITAKLVANLIAAAGADRVVCMDLHAAQIQGFFDIPVDHLTASKVLGEYFISNREKLGDLVIVSPDVGNVKVANMYASMLNADLAIIDKRRESGTNVSSKSLIGHVKNRTVLMVDDMISTAGTICEAARFVMDHGANEVYAAATHAVMVGLAMERLDNSPIREVIITDTIPDPDGIRLAPIRHKLKVLSVAELLGEAVHRIHHNMSISALFRGGMGTKR